MRLNGWKTRQQINTLQRYMANPEMGRGENLSPSTDKS
jgi:hypothetical protein